MCEVLAFSNMEPTSNTFTESQGFDAPYWRVVLGDNVHRLRMKQGIPKKTFSLMVGISRPLLDRIERGEADLRISYLTKVADGLSVSVLDLLDPHEK